MPQASHLRFLQQALVIANWKMNGSSAQACAWLDQLQSLLEPQLLRKQPLFADADRQTHCTAVYAQTAVALCPPSVCLGSEAVAQKAQALPFALGGQSCHQNVSGAHTGDISAAQLSACGAQYVIVGHSERRQDHLESNEQVRAQALAAQQAGLLPIICIGESLDQRNSGQAEQFVCEQLQQSIPYDARSAQPHGAFAVAYEPIWAIGTQQSATPAQISQMHHVLRQALPEACKSFPLLYGGSVNADNAAQILGLPHVNGALVGGASLDASSFAQIIQASVNCK